MAGSRPLASRERDERRSVARPVFSGFFGKEMQSRRS